MISRLATSALKAPKTMAVDYASKECDDAYVALLEEKSEIIRQLHTEIQDLKARLQQLEAPCPEEPPDTQELIAITEQLREEQRRLEEDETSLAQQARDMELRFSRERAELARQRNELERLQAEVRHEVEIACRQEEMRERLQPLLELHQTRTQRNSGVRPVPAVTTNPVEARPPAAAQAPQGSGLLRRLWGGA